MLINTIVQKELKQRNIQNAMLMTSGLQLEHEFKMGTLAFISSTDKQSFFVEQMHTE